MAVWEIISIYVVEKKEKQALMGRYIRFDWAAKHILRDKADFVVFDGLISALVGEQMTIIEMLESGLVSGPRRDRFNRLEFKAVNSKGELILLEIRQCQESEYMMREIHGTLKSVAEWIEKREDCALVKRICSIVIPYFAYGEGEDYLYHGQMTLIGVHTKDTLRLKKYELDDLNIRSPKDVIACRENFHLSLQFDMK